MRQDKVVLLGIGLSTDRGVFGRVADNVQSTQSRLAVCWYVQSLRNEEQ